MNNELFPAEAVTMDSPRLAWMKRHGLQVFHTPIDGLCECPETGEEIMIKARPAYKTVKIKALKKLKEMVA